MSANLKMTVAGAGLAIALVAIGIFPLTDDMPGHPVRWIIFGVICVGCALMSVALWWPRHTS